METSLAAEPLDLEKRLRRSKGRGGRVCSANARVTRAELDELERVAGDQEKTVSEWAREILLERARRPADDVLMTELIATRLLLLNLLKPLAMGKLLTDQEFAAISSGVQQNKRKVTREIQSQYISKTTSGA